MATANIIQKFGGINPMARKMTEALGKAVPPSTVQYWSESGFIPARRQVEVMESARFHSIELAPADFFEVA